MTVSLSDESALYCNACQNTLKEDELAEEMRIKTLEVERLVESANSRLSMTSNHQLKELLNGNDYFIFHDDTDGEEDDKELAQYHQNPSDSGIDANHDYHSSSYRSSSSTDQELDEPIFDLEL
jgi:hypothetical protein